MKDCGLDGARHYEKEVFSSENGVKVDQVRFR